MADGLKPQQRVRLYDLRVGDCAEFQSGDARRFCVIRTEFGTRSPDVVTAMAEDGELFTFFDCDDRACVYLGRGHVRVTKRISWPARSDAPDGVLTIIDKTYG